MTFEEMKTLPKEEQDKIYKRLKSVRKQWKPVNYGSIYGIGAPKLSREMGISVKEAQKMIDAYWRRNWAVKELVKGLKVRKINGQMWLLNPVNKFWYSLRYDKDRFSTLNQGTGSYVFDIWSAYYRHLGLKMCMQFHDEAAIHVRKGKEEETTSTLKRAVQLTNKKLKLNVPLDIDVKMGYTYSDVH